MQSPDESPTTRSRRYGAAMGMIFGTGAGVPVGVVLLNSTGSAWFMALSIAAGMLIGMTAGWLFITEGSLD